MATTEQQYAAQVDRVEALNEAFQKLMSQDINTEVVLPSGVTVSSFRTFLKAFTDTYLDGVDFSTGEVGEVEANMSIGVVLDEILNNPSLSPTLRMVAERTLTAPRPMLSIAALKKVTPQFPRQRFSTAYHSFPGWGGATYYHDPDDNSSVDNGGTVVITDSGAVLKLEAVTHVGNVTLWGADPTGKTDSSDACKRAIEYGVPELYFPNARFMIDSTVDLKNNGMQGEFWAQWGQRNSYVAVFAGPNLRHDPSRDDPESNTVYEYADRDEIPNDGSSVGFSPTGYMFADVKYARYLGFIGNGDNDTSACGLLTNAYVGHVEHCMFHTFYVALGQLACDQRVMRCAFTNCFYVGMANLSLATTITVAYCEHQYCDRGYWFSGDMVGGTWVDNVWEACGAPFVSASTLQSNRFLSTWFEKEGRLRDDGRGYPLFESRTRQQASDNFSSGNTIRFCKSEMNTWSNRGEPHNSKVGGVSTDRGEVMVSGTTGYRTFYSNNSLEYCPDPGASQFPYRIKTARINYGGVPISIQPTASLTLAPGSGEVKLVDHGADANDSSGTAARLLFARNTVSDNNARDEYSTFGVKQGIQLGGRFYFRATNPDAPANATGAARYRSEHYESCTPIFCQWTGAFSAGTGGTRVGHFDISEVDESNNRINIWSDHYEMRDPFLIVQCVNPDHEFVRWEPISSYGGSWSAYNICKGFRLYFRDKDSKAAVIPTDGFTLMYSNGA